MLGSQLTTDMRRFIDELIRKRRQKQATAKGRAIDCMELEDRILLSASPIAPEAKVNQQVEVAQTAPQGAKAVAADAHGNHVAVWSSQNADGKWDVHAQRFNAAGQPQGNSLQANSQASDEQQQATVSMNADGTFAITWTNKDATTNSADVYARLYNADGSPKGDQILVNSTIGADDQKNPSVAMDSTTKGFVVTWSSHDQDGWGVFGKRFDSNGAEVGGEFQISSSSSSEQIYSRVASDASGNFTVIWQNQDSNGWSILGQQFDSTGSRLGSEFQVGATAASETNASIAMNASGKFVVSWSGNDGDGSGIFAQRFNADGTLNGNAFLVNATTAGEQNFSAVAMDDSGAFLLTWMSYNQDSPGTWGVYSQAFAEDGSPFGVETLVNTTTEGSQVNASAAFLSPTSYVVVWSGNGVNDETGVLMSIGNTPLLQTNAAPAINLPGEQAFGANTASTFSTANGNLISVGDPDFEALGASVPVNDGGFEAAGLTDWYQSGGSYGGWNYQVEDEHNFGGIVANDCWWYEPASAPNGTQAAVIDGVGSVWQNVDFGQGGVFTMSLMAADCKWNVPGGGGSNPLLIQVDGVTIGTINPASTDYQSYSTNPFVVSSGLHRVALVGTTAGDNWNRATFVDGLLIDRMEPSVQVTLSADHGTLNLATTDGLSFLSGSGAGNAEMTFTGTMSAVNAALDGLQFNPTSGFAGTANLQITTSDFASVLAGGPASVTDSVAINVLTVSNNVPGDQDLNANKILTFCSGNGNPISVGISDSDLAILSDPTVQVTLTTDNGTLTLATTSGLSFSNGAASSSTEMTFSGTLADVNAALEGLQFVPTADYTGTAGLQMTTTVTSSALDSGPIVTSSHVTVDVSAPPIAGESLVNTTTEGVQQTATAGSRAVASDASGYYVVAWSGQDANGHWNVYAQQFNPDGSPWAAEFQVNTESGRDCKDVQVAVHNDCTFAITWTETDAGTADVYLRTFDAYNNPLQGQAILVNSDRTDGDQMHSSVAINNAGVAVVWTSQNGAGTWDVYAKWYDFNGNPVTTDADGNPVATEIQVNSTSSDVATRPQAAMDQLGYFLVVWQSETGGQQDILARYNSFCKPDDSWDRTEFVVTPTTEGNQYNPSLGFCDKTGEFVLSWTDGGSIYAQRFDWSGFAKSDAVQVGTNQAGTQDCSSVARNNDTGDFLITWSSQAQGAQDSWDVYSQLFTEDGTAFGAVTRVNTTTEGSQTASSATFLGSTNYVVTWSGNGVGDESGVFSSLCDTRLLRPENLAPVNTVPGVQVYDANMPMVFSQATGNAIQITDPDVYQSPQQVTLTVAHGTLTLAGTNGLTSYAGNGASTVTFTGMPADINAALDGLLYTPANGFVGTDALHVTTSDLAKTLAGGPKTGSDTIDINVALHPIADETPVDTATSNVQQLTDGPRSVASDSSGNYVVVWSSYSETGGWDVLGQRFRADGTALGGVFQVNTHAQFDQKDVSVDMRDDGTFAVVWTESDGEAPGTADVYLRTYDSNGNALQSEEILVNVSNTYGDQLHPAVAIENNGIAVVWTSQNEAGGWDLFAKRFDVDGSPKQNNNCNLPDVEYQMNSTSSAVPIEAQVAMDQWGYTMMVWQSETNGQQDILARYGSFCANDSWDTHEITLTSTTEGDQADPSLGFRNNGEFVLTWTANGAIYAQRYDWCAGRIGDEILVSPFSAGTQDNSSVVRNQNNGDFVVTWSVQNQDSWNVYSRYYTNDGVAFGPVTRVNTTAEASQTSSSVAFVDDSHYVVTWGGVDSPVHTSLCDMTLLRSENLAPVNTVPGAQTIALDTPLVFSGGDAFQITDPDAYPTLHQVTLTTDHGTLTLAHTNGLSFTSGGNGTATMTFTGMPADINAALLDLRFLPMVDYTGTAHIQITTNDLASVYVGGEKVDVDVVDVNITAPASTPTESLVNTVTTGAQETAAGSRAVASDASGNYVVVWSSQGVDGDWNVFAQRFNADGSAAGQQFQVNTRTERDQQDATVAMRDDGTFVVAWTESDGGAAGTADVYMRSFNSSGAALESEDVLVAGGNRDQMHPAVTINNSGIAVVWTSQNGSGSWDLFGKWYSTDGSENRSFQVNGVSSEAAIESQVGMDPWGYVMTVWQVQTNGQQDIYGRYAGFCNNDSWATDEFIINQTTVGNQYNASMGFKSNEGSFVVSWTSDGQGGTAPGIFAQRFDWCGGRIGSEFQAPAPITPVYTVSGSGADIWGSKDQFNFASESLFGDGEIIAKVDSLDNTNYWAKAGVMLRDDLNADSMHAMIYVNPEHLVVFQWRTNDGTGVSDVYSADTVNGAVWVKLVRAGDDFSAYYSTNGSAWTQLGATRHIDMQDTIQAGLAVTAHDNDRLCAARFSNVTINGSTEFALTDADVGSPGKTGAFSVGAVNAAAGSLDNSSVTVDKDTGNFVITWSGEDAEGSSGIYSQLYTSDGATYGLTQRVNATTEGSQANSSATFVNSSTYVVTWSGNGAADQSGIYASTTDTTLLRPENLAPVTTVPGEQTVEANTPIVFSAANGNAIHVEGMDRYPSLHQVTLNTNDGTIKLSRTDGLTFNSGSNGSGYMVFTGTLENINAALDGLKYMPTLNLTGEARIEITTNDLASVLAGGPKTDVDTVLINVSAPTSTSGLLGIYYNNRDWTGTPVYRVDPTVAFNWDGEQSPAPTISGTNWSASWQGEVQANESGLYTFYATGDDGIRLWVNGQLICDGWVNQSPTTYSGTISLEAGQWYSIRMDYFQGGGGAVAKLEWDAGQAGVKEAISTDHLRCSNLIGTPDVAPTVNVCQAQTGSVNSEVVFSSATGSAITVADSDLYPNQPLSVTLSVTNGLLSLGSTGGLSFTAGDGFQDGTITFTGSLSNINAALEGLKFLPTTVDFVGTAHLTVTVNDQAPFFAGGPQITTKTVDINMTVPTSYQGLLATYYNTSGGVNLAQGKAVTQSSDPWGYPGSNVTDGNVNNFNHTLNGANEWLQIDLSPGTNTQFNEITLINRPDGCGDRLQNFTISVIDAAGNTVWSQVYNEPTYTGQYLTFHTGNISGEYVRIQKNDSNYLHLAEVQVFNSVPSVTRIDSTLNFDWGNQGFPAAGINGADWTATWQGNITADYSEDYTFHITGDDGVRLWVNDQLILDSWEWAGGDRTSDTIHLEAGQAYSIRVEYRQRDWGANVKLEWSSASQQREVVSQDHLSCADLIHAGNAAPVNSVPGDQNAGVNSPVVFSSAQGNAITIGDADSEASATSVTITNSSFESGSGPNGAGWSFTPYYFDDISNYSGITSNGGYEHNGVPDGNQFAYIQGKGVISQDITFSEAGTYTLSFQAAHRQYMSGPTATNPFVIQIDGMDIATITPDSTVFEGYRITFTVDEGVHTLTFRGLAPGGGDRTSFIDRVAIDKVESLVQVQLSVNNGTLRLAQTGGLTFSQGSGWYDSTMTMTGTVADINAALDGLEFMPGAGFTGTADLQITTNDLAPALFGGQQVTTNVVAINVAVPTEHSGLLATYYNSPDLSGTGVQRIDSAVDFSMSDWGKEISPAPGVAGTNWSARWEGKIQATTTGEYTFYVTGDDGVRLWVNDAYVDGWTYQSGATYTLKTNLVAGQWYAIRMEYFQGGGQATAKLEWSAPGQARELVPASQLSHDNTAPVNTVPSGQTTDENTPVVFSQANHNAIVVSDLETIDHAEVNDQIEVTLSVDHGTLTLATLDGLTFTDGGDGSGMMTFRGTVGAINTALDGLRYSPAVSTSGQYIEAATVSITTNDLASDLTGGAKSTTSTVAIAITAPWKYDGLLATYYNNDDFTGASVQRVDSAIDFNWGQAVSPIEGIDGTTWSARWLGTVKADRTETYTFYTTANDGVRLWVNDVLLIDRLDNTGTDSYAATIDLVAGQTYSFRMDYRQTSGAAYAKLEWSSASQARETVCSTHFETADQTPTLILPSAQNGIGSQPIVFSGSQGNAIGVTELHYEGNLLTLTLTSQGTVTLNGQNGLDVTTGTANGLNTMTISGSLESINAALDGLCYTRATGSTAADSINFTVINPAAEGGSRSSSGSVQINAVQTSNPGLVATYYSDTWLGTAVATQIDSNVNFDWASGTSPVAGVGSSSWSARWDGLITAQATGTHTFFTTSDDGCRLWVNNQLLIDNWGSQGLTTNSATIDLVAGQQYTIRMEYCQNTAAGTAKLEWSAPGGVRETVSAGALSHQNQAPVHYLPASASVNQDTALVFSGANAIRISDVDAQTSSLQVKLTASNGTLTLSATQGLTVAGNGTAAVTITGSLADINAALAGSEGHNALTFNPTANYKGGASLRIVTTDLGTGKTADSSTPITVIAVNHAPTISISGTPTVSEGSSVTFSSTANAIVIADQDIDASTYVNVVNGNFESPNIGTGYYADQYHGAAPGWNLQSVYLTNGNTVVNSSGLAGNDAGIGNPDSVEGPGSSQVAYIQGGASIWQDVTFAQAGEYTLTFQSAYREYGGRHSFMVMIDGVSIGTFNPDSLAFKGYNATFSVSAGTHRLTFRGINEGGDKTAFIDHVSIVRNDALVQVNVSADHGTLTLANTNGLIFTGDCDGVNDTSISFKASLADANAVLDGLKFTPIGNYTGPATLRVTANDLGNSGVGGPKSSTATKAIAVTAVNEAPFSNVPTTVQGTFGNQPIVFSTSGNNAISVGDPDAAISLLSATVSNSSFESPGATSLMRGGAAGGWTFTAPFTQSNGTPTASGIVGYGTYNNYYVQDGQQAAFIQGNGTIWQDVNFTDAGNYALKFLAAARMSGGDTIQVQIDGVNVGVISPAGTNYQSYQTNAFFVTAGTHRITFAGVAPAGQDVMTFIDQVSVAAAGIKVEVTLASHGTIALSGQNGLTVTTGQANGLNTTTITGTIEDVNAALDGMSYVPVSGFIGTDQLTITTNDLGNGGSGGPLSATSTVEIKVAGAPVVNSTTDGVQQTSWQSPQAVAADANGNYVVVWMSQNQDGDGWGIYARRFNASGTAQGNEFLVNTLKTAGDQAYATVAMNADGSFAITWTDSTAEAGSADVYAKLYNADGSVRRDQFLVNTTTGNDQMYSSVAMDAEGGFIVTWSSQSQAGDEGWGVYGQRFDANGQKVGGELQISESTAGDQEFARTAIDQNGNFTVVWQSQGADGWDVCARQFDSLGQAKGSQFRVNTTTAGDQENANIGMNASGEITVSWTSVDQQGVNQGVFSQRYNADGTPNAADTVHTVTGAGNDIGWNSDQGTFASTDVDGNVTMIAKIDSMTNSAWNAKAGLMFRDSSAADASFAMVFATPGQGVAFQWRGVSGDGNSYSNSFDFDQSGPVWLKLTRVGNEFSAYYSKDGSAWTQLGSTQTITMNSTAQVGFAVGSLNVDVPCTAKFSHATINGQTNFTLSDADIGSPAIAGSYSASAERQVAGAVDNTYTVQGCGSDIWFGSDQFNFASTDATGDTTMIAQVTSVMKTGDFAKAGVMFRDDLNSDSMHAMIYVNPENLVVFQWRSSDGSSCFDVYSAGNVDGTAWVKLVRVGNEFSGYYSTDKINWTQVGETRTIEMGQTFKAGLEVSSWTADKACTATFRDVTINGSKDFTLTDRDIGSPGIAGSLSITKTLVTNTDADRSWDYSSVAVDREGNSIVTWTDSRRDASNDSVTQNVFAQRYAADGDAVGSATQVNIVTGLAQGYSSVTALSPDNYMVIWSGGAAGEDAGVMYSEQAPVGLLASYYNNMTLSGTPVQRIDGTIDFTWGTDWGNEVSPATGIGVDMWSASWEGMIRANTSETYTFYATTDDGVRVWVNGQLVIDNWNYQYKTEVSGSINLLAGQWYSIRMEYFQHLGPDSAKLEWSSATVAREVIPSTQLTHLNQAPVIAVPVLPSTLEGQSLTFSSGVSVPVDDNSFESADVGLNHSQYGGSSGGWTFAAQTNDHGPSGSGVAANGSEFINLDAPTGHQVAFIQGQGAISRDVTFAESGDYAISFLAALRDYGGGSNPITVQVDGVNVGTFTPGSTAFQLYQTDSFSVTAGTHHITFAGLTTGGADKTSFIDNVSIASAHSNAIRISDVDSTSESIVTVTLAVDHGTVKLSGIDGLTMVAGNWQGDSLMTLRGTIGSINTALDGLVFTPTKDFRGQAMLSITSRDEGGMGGPETTTTQMPINVIGVNHAPENSVPIPQSVEEHQTLIFSHATGNAITVSDFDAGDSAIQVTLTANHGTLSLSGANGLTLTDAQGNPTDGVGDATIVIRGTVSAINEALDGLQFKPTDQFGGDTTLHIATDDLGNSGIGGNMTAASDVKIHVTAINDAPVNVLPTGQTAFTQYVKTFSSQNQNAITIADPDADGHPVEVTLSVDQGTLSLNRSADLDRLTISTLDGSNDGINDALITIRGTLADINAALDGLQFRARDGFQGVARLQVTTNDLNYDGAQGIGGAQKTSSMMAINTRMAEAPAVVVRASQTTLEHNTLVFSEATGNALRIVDIDVGDLPIQVTISTDFGKLSLRSTPALAAALNAQTLGATSPNVRPLVAPSQLLISSQGNSITITGTVAEVNAALDGLKLTPDAFQSNRTAHLTITVSDLAMGQVGATPGVTQKTLGVELVAVNDAPVITMPELTGHDPTMIVFSSTTGNAIHVGDPDAGNSVVMMTILTSDGNFSLGDTGGLTIVGGAPVNSEFIRVQGTLADINKALDGLTLKPYTSDAAMQISVDDGGVGQGLGGAKTGVQTFYVRRMTDPNFQPADSGARFQVRAGVMTQQISTTMVADSMHGLADLGRMAQLDSAQVNPSLFLADVSQHMNVVRGDSSALLRGADRLNRDRGDRMFDMADGKDVKATEGGQFSADTQNVNESAQEGSILRRDESILVGIGVVSAGYLAWALHGGSLLAGAISTTPMWMPFDPLAVLDFSDRAVKGGLLPLDQEAGIAGDENLQSLLS
jgi:hypothetical protein